MDVVAEVRTMVVAIPRGDVAAYGDIGRALGIGPRQAGRAVAMLARACHGGELFTPTARRRAVITEEPERCSKRKAFRSATAAWTCPRFGDSGRSLDAFLRVSVSVSVSVRSLGKDAARFSS